MRRISRVLHVLAACAGLACGCRDGDAPSSLAPPLPGNLSELDPRVVQRIRPAHERVVAEPASARAWAELGLVYEAERLRNLALACFQEASARDPAEPRWPYREACTLSALGRPAEASSAIERSIALEPGYAPSHWRAGDYRLGLGELEAAERSFRRAIELDPAFPGGWYGLARLHLQRDESQAAVLVLEDLRRRQGEDGAILRLLAEAYRQVGRAEELGDAAALQVDEDGPVWNDPWELEARAYRQDPALLHVGEMIQDGRTEEAVQLLLDARRASGDPLAHALQLAEAYLELGRHSESEREVRALIESEPGNSGAHVLLSRLHQGRGEIEAALEELEIVTTLQPTYGGAFAAQGMLFYRQGDLERAAGALARALELGVSDAEVRYTLGQAQLTLNRWPDARSTFEALVALESENGDAWAGLAKARLKLRDLPGAESALERALATTVRQRGFVEQVREAVERARARRERREAGEPDGGEPDGER